MTKITINDARWQAWADKFLAAPLSDPGNEKTGMIMQFFMMRRSLDEDELKHLEADFSEHFAYKVAKAHAARLGLKLEEEGMQFLSLISDNLGALVMNIHGARRLQQKLGVEELSMKELFETAYGTGLRSDEILHELWDEQKIHVMLTEEEREALGGGMDNFIDRVWGLDENAKDEFVS